MTARKSAELDSARAPGSQAPTAPPPANDPGEPLRRLARGVAHDLSNAISPVLGYAELLLQDERFAGRQRTCLERIEAGAARIVEILDRLDLYYREVPRRAPIDVPLADLVREVIARDFAPPDSPPTADRGFDLNLAEGVQAVADPQELSILVGQLLRNAVEAAAVNRSRPRVRSFQSGERAGLEVMDSGSGMSPDILATCCEPFRTTKSAVGAGLGLSMCQGIVRRVQGSLEIESAPGRGTTVRVLLPIAGAGRV